MTVPNPSVYTIAYGSQAIKLDRTTVCDGRIYA